MDDLHKQVEDFIAQNAEWSDEHHKSIELRLPEKEESSYFKDDLGASGCFRKLEID